MWLQGAFIASDAMVAFMVCWSFFFHHADTLKRVLQMRKVKLKKLKLGMTKKSIGPRA